MTQSTAATQHTEALLGGRGQLDLAYLGRLTQERVGYGIYATRWTGDAENSTLAHTLSVSSMIEPDAGLRISLRGSAMLTQTSILDNTSLTAPQATGVRPAGDQRFLAIEAGQSLTWRIGAAWSVAESMAGRLFRPIGSVQPGVAENRSAVLDWALNHLWQADSVGIHGQLGANSTDVGASEGPNHAEFAQTDLAWRHEWRPEMSSQLSGGLLMLYADEARTVPAAAATVDWNDAGRAVGLRAARMADTNMYSGTIYQRDLVGLTIGLPLDRYQLLRLSASGELDHVSSPASSNGPAGTANLLILQCGLRWQPGELFTFGLEYWFRDQFASTSDSAQPAFANFRRQMAMFTIDVRYPPPDR
jgi:hypothetical protein